MSRKPRSILAGQPMHIIQRGNNRSALFCEPADYCFFASLLLKSIENTRCALHAYVFMGNHFHLLLTPADAFGPSRLMQSVGLSYVRFFNRKYGRTGTLWEGRYRSTRIESQRYFFTCSRYIELNPVRALLIEHPGQYRWSSFSGNAIGTADALITPHPLYRALGGQLNARLCAYRELFRMHLDPAECQQIRRATNSGAPLGELA